MRAYIPPMKPVPADATEEERNKLYSEYRAELVRLNPTHFNPDGSLKTWWQSFVEIFRSPQEKN